MTETCETCAFYRFAGFSLDGWTAGRCQRSAPVPRTESGYGESYPVGKWPLVQARNWCGEYREQAGGNRDA